MGVHVRSLAARVAAAVALPLAVLGLTACEPDPAPDQTVLFALDLSNSTEEYREEEIALVRRWVEAQPADAHFIVRLAAMDRSSGSSECTSPPVSFSGEGNNPETQAQNRDKAVADLSVLARRFVECQVDLTGGRGGSDLIDPTAFAGATTVVFATDGLVFDRTRQIRLTRRVLADAKALRQATRRASAGAGQQQLLAGVRVEIYGLGYRADLGSPLAQALGGFWSDALGSYGAVVDVHADFQVAPRPAG